MDEDKKAPLFVDRISHVVGVVRPENLESAMAKMGRALQVEFEGPFLREDTGLRAGVAARAGIELIAPATPDHPLHDHLARCGEGWFAVGFGVRDQDETGERLRQLGQDQLQRVVRTGMTGWADDYDRIEVTIADRSIFGGLQMVFATFE